MENTPPTTAISITKQPSPDEWTEDRVSLLKKTICKSASDDELKLFLMVCRRTRLDPFARQIYAVKRKEYDADSGGWIDKFAYQVSIDGMRLVAERTGDYEGQTEAQWCGPDGKWLNVWLKKEVPSAGRVGVYRKGFKDPVYGVARFDAYCQTKKDGRLNKNWEKMADVMIAKCAESLALRKAFPQDLSGLYSEDEMSSLDKGGPEESASAPLRAEIIANKEQVLSLVSAARTAGYNEADVDGWAKKFGVMSKQELTLAQMDEILAFVKSNVKAAAVPLPRQEAPAVPPQTKVEAPKPPVQKVEGQHPAFTISQKQIGFLMGRAKDSGFNEADVDSIIKSEFGLDSKKKLTRQQMDLLLEFFLNGRAEEILEDNRAAEMADG